MKKSSLTSFILLLVISISSFSQQEKVKLDESLKKGGGVKSSFFQSKLMGTRNAPSSDLKWRPILNSKCIAFEPEAPEHKKIKEIKEEKAKLKKKNIQDNPPSNSSRSVQPTVGTNFAGNTNNGSSPLDNSVAISDGGWIISVANSTIEFDNTLGVTSYFQTLKNFIGDPAINSICDPVVLYDKGADRFIVFAQECSGNSSNSNLLIMFSKSNNPNSGWWYYKITGNPKNNSNWFDYPKLGISNNELYITGNLFTNSGSFTESIIYQINKQNGYSGASSLTWSYWHSISGNPFTLLPVSNGHGLGYGPGCYFVATSPGGSSTIKLYDLTDYLTGSPSLNYYPVATTLYSPAGNASQSGTTTVLDNGDCRALSGFYLNGIIHFVFHSDIGSGYNGINYNRLDVTTRINTSKTYGASGTYDYSYPSVASFTTNSTDKSVMIGFGASGSSIFPQMRVVNCDDGMNYSSSTLVKSSASYASYTSTSEERWGDYTGMARKHNSTYPTVWMSGSFAQSNKRWNTWISEIIEPNASINESNKEVNSIKVFPNPVVDVFNLEFNLEKEIDLTISIFDIKGKEIKQLYKGKGFVGENVFSFNKANLSPGTYLLSIKSSKKIIKNEKIILSN